MKSQKTILKMLQDIQAEIEKTVTICQHCGALEKDHTEERDPKESHLSSLFCVQGEYSRRFKVNDQAMMALQNRQRILEWVLEQDETYVSIDDCIMPETVVATFSKKKTLTPPAQGPKVCDKCKGPMSETQPILFPGLFQCEDGDCANSMMMPVQELDFPLGFDVNVDDLDEPYRGILLAASNKLPITLPGVLAETVQVVTFAIFPSGSVYRNYNTITEDLFEKMDKQKLKDVLPGILNKEVIEELTNRYGGM